MAWSKLEDSFREHRKFKRMATDLGIRAAEARGLMAGLYSWALTQAPDGDLSDHTPEEIEEAMDWEGETGIAFASACDQKLIDNDEKGIRIHGYLKRAEGYKAAQRVAKHRKKKRRKAQSASCYRNATVTLQKRDSNVERRGEERRREEKRGEEKNPLSTSQAKPTARKSHAGEIKAIIAHYQTHHPRSKPGAKEKKKIRERLDEGYSAADLCKAIDGCHRTPHNTGQNDRNQTYLGLELIMRTSDQVARFIENADRFAEGSAGTIKAHLTEKTRRTVEAGQRWLEGTGNDAD